MFNYQNFIYTNEGIANYYWPADRKKTAKVLKQMIQKSVSFLKNQGEDEFIGSLKLLNVYFILKMINHHQEKALSVAIKNPKIVNLDSNIFQDYREFNNPQLLDYLKILESGFRPSLLKKHKFQNIRNFMATKIKNDRYIRSSLAGLNFSESVIATGPSPLGTQYLKKIEGYAFLTNIVNFFPGVDVNEIKTALGRKDNLYFNSEIFNDYMKVFSEIFKNDNLDLMKSDLSHITDWTKSFIACSKYYQDILAKNQFLPSKLWTGSAGIFLNKLLALEVRKRGGVVTIFDHAHGSTLEIDTFMPLIEFQEANEFITHSDTFVKYLSEASIYQLYHDNCPSIISIK